MLTLHLPSILDAATRVGLAALFVVLALLLSWWALDALRDRPLIGALATAFSVAFFVIAAACVVLAAVSLGIVGFCP